MIKTKSRKGIYVTQRICLCYKEVFQIDCHLPDYSPYGELEFGRLVNQGATAKASQETFKNITNSFSMQINRRVNQGTPRGAGNIKGEDIKKSPKTRPLSLMSNVSTLSEI